MINFVPVGISIFSLTTLRSVIISKTELFGDISLMALQKLIATISAPPVERNGSDSQLLAGPNSKECREISFIIFDKDCSLLLSLSGLLFPPITSTIARDMVDIFDGLSRADVMGSRRSLNQNLRL